MENEIETQDSHRIESQQVFYSLRAFFVASRQLSLLQAPR